MKLAQTTRPVFVLLAAMSLSMSLLTNIHVASRAKSNPPPTPVSANTPSETKLDAETVSARLPLTFEPNRGQADKQAKFISRPSGHGLFISATEAWLTLNSSEQEVHAVRMHIVGGDSRAAVSGEEELKSKSHYLVGNRQTWKRGVPNYKRVRVEDVYPGIDVLYYGTDQRRLEYDFVVAPEANHKQISLKFEGADKKWIDESGALHLHTKSGDVVQPAPVVYQEIDGMRVQRSGRYLMIENLVKFEIGDYNHEKPLIIDPQLVYASFHGGAGDDRAKGVAVDLDGNAYVMGSTTSTNLELRNAFQGSLKGSSDIFLIKVNPSGTELLYSTYIGGKTFDDGRGIAVTSDGRACIVGSADNSGNSSDYPVTNGAYQGNGFFLGSRGGDGIITLFNANGDDLEYSTFFGGGDDNDGINGVALDADNKIYVTGEALSWDFPTKHAFQSHNDFSAFVAKFDPELEGNDSLIYSSVLNGNDKRSAGVAIAVTPVGVAFFTGTTNSPNFPTRSASSLPPFQTTYAGEDDTFVAKVSPDGDLIYSTLYGGDRSDIPTGIAVDSNERVYITGLTTSSAATFPFKNAIDSNRDNPSDAFVAKFNADGTTVFYSTVIPGCDLNVQGEGIAVDSGGSAFVTGTTVCRGVSFPEINPVPGTPAGGTFLVKIGPSDATGTIAPTILLSDTFQGGTPEGGIALDRRGNIFIAGLINAETLLVQSQNFQGTRGGGLHDAFVVKFTSPSHDTTGTWRPSSNTFLLRNSNTAGNADTTIQFGEKGDLPIAGDWDGNGVSDVGVFRPSRGEFILHVPQVGGTISTITINFGSPGDLPVAGDWNGDGIDTPGVFRPGAVGNFLLTNSILDGSAPAPDIVFNFGVAGDRPVAGDWNGDGVDTIGVFRVNGAGEFHLSNEFENSTDIFFNFGTKGDLPIAGDWTGKGFDTPGLYRPSKSTMFLANNFLNVADVFFVFGQSGDLPVAGDWDGK